MSREIIAVDVDDVLFPFLKSFTAHHNQMYGTALQPEGVTDTYETVLDLPMAEVGRRIDQFHRLDDLHIAPIAGSQKAIEALAARHDLHIITARHPQFEPRTSAWVAEYFPGMFKSITHIGFAGLMPEPRTKIEVCQEIGASVLVDDAVHHVGGCAQANIQGVWFGTYPYQKGKILPPSVIACDDWQSVLEYFDGRDR